MIYAGLIYKVQLVNYLELIYYVFFVVVRVLKLYIGEGGGSEDRDMGLREGEGSGGGGRRRDVGGLGKAASLTYPILKGANPLPARAFEVVVPPRDVGGPDEAASLADLILKGPAANKGI